jgi:hypothetical protein
MTDLVIRVIQKQTQSKENIVDLHLILEASVSLWELSLHGPAVHEDVHLGPAAAAMRKFCKLSRDPRQNKSFVGTKSLPRL